MRNHCLSRSTTSSPHTARYLILLGSADAKRALLFSGECEYLAEMIDEDGLTLEQLLRSGTMCPPPRELGLDDTVSAACVADEELLCIALGGTGATNPGGHDHDPAC
jgi:hypothetical protein